MSELQFTTVDRVIAKLHAAIRGTEINETDLIEWIGDALALLKTPQIQEEALAFLEVKNHHADMPEGFQMVIQIARSNNWVKNSEGNCNICPKEVIEKIEEKPSLESVPVVTDCQGNLIGDYEYAYYRPKFDLKWEYDPFYRSNYYRTNFTPVRLANSTLFNTLVCKNRDKVVYTGNEDEYTIVGTLKKRLRFSFKEGFIVMAYYKNAIDLETGYPLVPDNVNYINAIIFYLKWQIASLHVWNKREGYERIASDAEQKWLKYATQAKNWAKMPKSIDQYQNLLEQSYQLVPRHSRYHRFFGKTKR